MHCSGTERQWAILSVMVNFPAHLFVAGASLFNLARFHSLFIVTQRCTVAERAVDFSLGIPSCHIRRLHRKSHHETMRRFREKRKEKFGSPSAVHTVSRGLTTRGLTVVEWKANYKAWTEYEDGWSGGRMRRRRAAVSGNTNAGKEQGEQQRTWKLDTRGSQTVSEITLRTLFFFHNVQFQSLQLKRIAIFETTVLFETVRNIQPSPPIWNQIIYRKKKKKHLLSITAATPSNTFAMCSHLAWEPALITQHPLEQIPAIRSQNLVQHPLKRALSKHSAAAYMRPWPLKRSETIQLPWISSAWTSTKSLQCGENQGSTNSFTEVRIYTEWEDWIAASAMEMLTLYNCAAFHSLQLPPDFSLTPVRALWPASPSALSSSNSARGGHKNPGPICTTSWWSGLGTLNICGPKGTLFTRSPAAKRHLNLTQGCYVTF